MFPHQLLYFIQMTAITTELQAVIDEENLMSTTGLCVFTEFYVIDAARVILILDIISPPPTCFFQVS